MIALSPQNDNTIKVAKCLEASNGAHESAQTSFACDAELAKSLNLEDA